MSYCFYLDWHGLTAEEWAAWAQALLSALAIVVAARMTMSQERRALRSRIDAYLAIISHAYDEAQGTVQHLKVGIGKSASSNVTDEWTRLCQVFDAIPFHEVPDFSLYGVLVEASRASANIRDIYEPLLKSGKPVGEIDYELAKTEEHRLEIAYDDAVAISNKLADPSFLQNIRYKLFKLKNKAGRWIGSRKT